MKKSIIIGAVALAAAGTSQAAIVFQDTFDNDNLGTNTGIGGGMASGNMYKASWADDGALTFASTKNHQESRASAYSVNTFLSTGGFELTVNYNVSQVTDNSDNQFSFGLIRDDLDVSTYGFAGEDNPYGVWNATANLYSIGVNVMADAGIVEQGVHTTSGTTTALVDAGTTVAGADTTIVLSVLNNGSGGANVSWSVGGVDQGSATVASFDFTKEYAFLAFAADQEVLPVINSVSLEAIPEPATLGLVGAFGGGILLIRRRFML